MLLLVFAIVSFPARKVRGQPARVRVVYPSVDVQYLPAYVAQVKGIFKEESLEVELIVIRGARSGVQALISDDVQFVLPVGPSLPAIWSGADLKILGQMSAKATFSLIVRPEIQAVKDLRGKKIGVSLGGAPFAFVHELLKTNGIDPDKGVEYVNLPGASPKIAALEKGLIAAAPLAPPGDLKAVRVGFKRLVFFGDTIPEIPFTGLVATTRYIRENPQTVEKMVRAIVRAVYVTRDDPGAAMPVIQRYLNLEADEARETYNLIRSSFSPILTETGLKNLIGIMSQSSGLKPTREPRDYTDVSFLNKVLSGLGKR